MYNKDIITTHLHYLKTAGHLLIPVHLGDGLEHPLGPRGCLNLVALTTVPVGPQWSPCNMGEESEHWGII